MAKTKVYDKKGNYNYEEKRYINELRTEIEKRMESDKNFAANYKPATTLDELKAQHLEYCTTEVPFTEEKNPPKGQPGSEKNEFDEAANNNSAEEIPADTTNPVDENHIPEKKPDVFNRANPKIRSYVLDESFTTGNKNPENHRTSFDEPASFDDSFKMPDPLEEAPTEENGTDTKGGKKDTKQPKTESTPINPQFDTMSTAKQRKQTHRFAKHIVKLTCKLAERGLIWYTTKDINDVRIAEYDLSGEIDMDILLQLEGQQDRTVRAFFHNQCLEAKEMAKFTEAEQNELIEALEDVLLEKGVAPTPMQNLILAGLEIFAPKLLDGLARTSQNKGVILQLKQATAGSGGGGHHEEETPVEEIAAENTETPAEVPAENSTSLATLENQNTTNEN